MFTVVPLTADRNLAPASLSTRIDPDDDNGLKKPSYALAWNIQTVAKERITTTTARVTRNQIGVIRRVLVEYITATHIEDEPTKSADSNDDSGSP